MNDHRDFFVEDQLGRTLLFEMACAGDLGAIEKVIFSLPGTGVYSQRYALISHKDKEGETAIEAAREHGNREIAVFLERELLRMQMFE